MFRNLYPSEIEVRVQQVKDKGCSLLLYKDARCDMAILDETVTPFGWKREHLRDNKNCIVSIWNESTKMWVPKEDTGTESNTEQAKGLASDSFKRACFNWGIGRELYSSPFIWINFKDGETSKHNGKLRLAFGVRFRVSKIISGSNKHIEYLEIVDNSNNIRFSHGKEPSLRWYVNEELKKKSEEIRNDYITKIQSKELEVNQELLDCLRGLI